MQRIAPGASKDARTGRLSRQPRRDRRAVVIRGSPRRLAPQDDGPGIVRRPLHRHCERSEAIQESLRGCISGLLRYARNDDQTHLRILAAHLARDLRPSCSLRKQRAQGRPGAGWAPTVRCARMREEQMHSGIQVKPNIRPSLRSGFTAYVALSPGSDALLPPSPCERSQDLTYRPRTSGPHDFAVRETAPVVRTRRLLVRRSPRPPPLTPRFVTIAIRPSDRDEVTGEYDNSEFR